MSLTHGAISRHIKVLEGQLGVRLVVREGARLKTTPAAHEYCQRLRAILQNLSRSTLTLSANPAGGSLNLAILPAFGVHWLAPRLKSFALAHPEVTVNLSTRLGPFDLRVEALDAALHYGKRDWPGMRYLELAEQRVLPVCAPGFLDRPVGAAEDFLHLPLLHLETRTAAWTEWFAAQGIATTVPRGMLFDQVATMAQAAVHGMGIALLPHYLAEVEIDVGHLVSAYGEPVPFSGRYFLVWPERDPVRPQVETFVSWLNGTL